MRKYLINVLIGIDQLINAVCMGDPDETISSRVGKIRRANGGRLSFMRHPLPYIIDWLTEAVDTGHTIDAIEDDEGKDNV